VTAVVDGTDAYEAQVECGSIMTQVLAATE